MNAPGNDILPVPYSEDAVALKFTARHGPEWRYVAKWNRWLYWTGTHWAEDDRLKVFDLIRNERQLFTRERRLAAGDCIDP